MDFKFRILCDDCNGEGYLEEFRQGSDVIVDCWECDTKGWHETFETLYESEEGLLADYKDAFDIEVVS
jgi:excinuclease UvrABC ATPase subunit|tara:strand:- start:297 stop:500 length:204 start_codon:yes stop_codon:yes gene_type:complete